MSSLDYWIECVSESAIECKANLTREQIEYIADAVKSSHENYGLFSGENYIPDPVESETKRELQELKNQIKNKEDWEASTVPCKSCNTTGLICDCWGRDIKCGTCGGKGRVRKINW